MKFANVGLFRKGFLQTFVALLLIVGIVLGFWYGSQMALNTKIPPVLAVVSGSMCVSCGGSCDGWTHPFDQTLHKGDVVVIQGVDCKDLKTGYPDSDVIVFRRPDNPSEFVVHRIVASEVIDGKLFFYTKGDGNSPVIWPNVPGRQLYDSWFSGNASIPQGAVSEDLVVGKVVFRVPWVGYVSFFVHDVLGVNNSYVGIVIIVALLLFPLIFDYIKSYFGRQSSIVEQNSAAG